MIKNRTAQLIFQTIYCTLGFVGFVACLGIFDDITMIRWDFYVHFTNLSNFLCIGVMLTSLIQTIKKKRFYNISKIVTQSLSLPTMFSGRWMVYNPQKSPFYPFL